MDKFPLILPTVGWNRFVFGRVIKITPPGKVRWQSPRILSPHCRSYGCKPADWRSHLPSAFRTLDSPVGSHTIEPLEMTWVFSDIQYTVVAIECRLWEPRHTRILKGSGPINTTDCQSLTCTFHRVFAASRCRSDDFKQHPTDWCSSFRLAKNLNCPTSLVVSKIFNESQMIVAELDGFMFINPETSSHSLHIGVSKSMILPHIPWQNTPEFPNPPTTETAGGGVCGVSSSGMLVRS